MRTSRNPGVRRRKIGSFVQVPERALPDKPRREVGHDKSKRESSDRAGDGLSSHVAIKENVCRTLDIAEGHQHKSRGARKPDIIVVDPRAFFRGCVVRAFESSCAGHDIYSFASIDEWVSSRKQGAPIPDAVLLFAEGDGSSGLAHIQTLESMAPGVPVVLISDVDDVNHVMRAFKGGVRGYISAHMPYDIAIEAVRLVVAGGTFVPASSMALNRDKLQIKPRLNELLTERQMKVVEGLRQGMANKEIATELNMSEHTVKVHVRHVMRKLNAKNRTEVAVLTRAVF